MTGQEQRDYTKTTACPRCDSGRVHKRQTMLPQWKCRECRETFCEAIRRPRRPSPPQEPFEPANKQSETCPVCKENISRDLPVHLRHNCDGGDDE